MSIKRRVASDAVLCCRHCGSDNGIAIKQWQRFAGVYSYRERSEFLDYDGVSKGGKRGTCLDCGKAVCVPTT